MQYGYTAHELNEEVCSSISAEWYGIAENCGDSDKEELIKYDTDQALKNDSYTHAIFDDSSKEYVALVGIIKAKPISAHKVLELRLNPSSNPEYMDEEEIGLSAAADDIAGTILALADDVLFKNDMYQVKIFARGHEMKTLFKLVAEHAEKSVEELKIRKEGSWLVVTQAN